MTEFALRVLEIFSITHTDASGDLMWRVEDGEIFFYADVSDVFAWGGADVEPITPQMMHVLEGAYASLKAVGGEEFTAELYAARIRGMRPQGAAYPGEADHAFQAVSDLFDACGPERPTGLGNPRKAPAHMIHNVEESP